LEHPNIIEPNKQQLDKINLLNEFLSTYKLLKMQEHETKICLNSSAKAGDYFASILGGVKNKEKFLVAFLDNSNSIIETRTMSEGTIGEAVVYPRDILKAALDCDCKSIVISHNHPGGSLSPSMQDKDLTERLVSIFTPLNINILDHIIVANTSYHSMAEQGYMPSASPSSVNYEAFKLSDNHKVKEEIEDMKFDNSVDELNLEDLDFSEHGEEEDEWER
jgi:DNA repair protein RadC